ncbi:hypothetical protein QJS04_geneDACA021310 [Acorus gramineus]|uniref:RanBD1 domain-containing protein n=1 Tax=Acorus gramineus TaxID=55184 RepID=A0AAV9ALD3_ACOGR|nr:hypothetical protein QJS04_geneDACA021310 [Acorus gramineus]
MGDSECAIPPSKKRVAGRELSRDDPGLDDDDDAPEQELETFKKASEEVMATRRIVKVRRNQPSSTPSSNPFAAIRLVPPAESDGKTMSSTSLPHPVGDKAVLEEEGDAVMEKVVEGEGTRDGAVLDEPNETKVTNKEMENVTDISAGNFAKEEKNDVKESVESEEMNKPKDTEKEDTAGEETKETAKPEEEGKTTTAGEGAEDASEDKEAAKPEEGEKTTKGGEEAEDASKEEESSKSEDVNVISSAKTSTAGPFSLFQQLSSGQNAFTGFAGTGFSSSSFSFGMAPKESSPFGVGSGSLFDLKSETKSFPSFGAGNSTNGGSMNLFGTTTSDANKAGGSVIAPLEGPIETGEENEKCVFNADAVLFEFIDGGWKERGKGELKVNVSTLDAGKSRLVMRARGNYRLILNASLYPDMSLTNMDKRGITFACINSAGEGKGELVTFALKFKDSSFVEEFRGVVTSHKGEKTSAFKTPENSPKASDE